MATPLGRAFSTAENQVSQCDEQTFGSTAECKGVGVAGTPLANSSKHVSVETDKALCKPTMVFWCNKEGQNLEPVTFENLIVHFDQDKSEELLSGGGPMLNTRKHRKVSVTKVSEKKPAIDRRVAKRISSQLLLASREASQVPCEHKSPLPK